MWLATCKARVDLPHATGWLFSGAQAGRAVPVVLGLDWPSAAWRSERQPGERPSSALSLSTGPVRAAGAATADTPQSGGERSWQ